MPVAGPSNIRGPGLNHGAEPAATRLLRRADYLRVQAAECRAARPGVLLQAASVDDPAHLGLGFTASKKVGNAVRRNRARRRLKALAAEMFPRHARAGHDYVLVARQATPERPFADLRRDLEQALRRLRLWQPGQPEAGA